jgi:DNA-binding response OmpR family regulator
VPDERILVVEDDHDIASLIERYLSREGYEVRCAFDGASALDCLARTRFALIVLDLRLPRMDGLEVLRRVREGPSDVSVIILSSRKEEMDKVTGLELGADDYMTKPFSMPELTARIKARLRRRTGAHGIGPNGSTKAIAALDLSLDAEQAVLRRAGREIDLTPTEIEILRLLMSHPGRIFTKSQIIDAVRGGDAAIEENAVTVHVSNLRRKLGEDASSYRYIQTVWGIGYRFPEEH